MNQKSSPRNYKGEQKQQIKLSLEITEDYQPRTQTWINHGMQPSGILNPTKRSNSKLMSDVCSIML